MWNGLQVKSSSSSSRRSGASPVDADESSVVLNRSSDIVVLAENEPVQLSPDVVRSSGASSWDDVGELEAGRTRSLLQHWRATEEESAVPKTSTTRHDSILAVHRRSYRVAGVIVINVATVFTTQAQLNIYRHCLQHTALASLKFTVIVSLCTANKNNCKFRTDRLNDRVRI